MWRDLFEQAPVPYALYGLDCRLLLANDAYGDLFGVPPADMAGLHLLELTHPDDRLRTDAFLRDLVSGTLARVETDKRYVRADGSVFWGHLVATSLHTSAGEPWALLGTVQDVTGRVDAERALAERETWFKSLVQNVSDAIVVADAAGRLAYASPSAEQLTGASAADAMGLDVLGFVHPDDRDVVALSFQNTAQSPGPQVPLRFRVLRRDGSTRVVEAVATNLLDDPGVRGIVGNLRDLTDVEAVAVALELSEQRFRRMLENISDTVTLIGADAHVQSTTGNVKEILGYPVDFWSLRNAFDLCHPEDADRARAALERLLSMPGGEMTDEFRVRAADGRWAHVEVSGANLLEDPDVAAIVLTTRNITQRKEAERALARARDDALRALEQRMEFVATVSHELRTPIHGILGLAELLASSDLDEDGRNMARSILRATDTLRMVLDDILDFAKIEAGRLELSPGPFPVAELVTDLRTLYAPQAELKGVAFDVVVDPEHPAWVEGDALRVRQVLANLVSNAVKFTSVGRVRLEFERAAGGITRMIVEDTGLGIPPEVSDSLFVPFSQANRDTAREFGGTGLGLTIARRLVELMGGVLGFDSTPGVGSRFWVTLPLPAVVAPAHATLSETIGVVRPAPLSPRVLVVEDNAVNQLLVRRQLDRLGYASVVVDSGFAALELLATERFAVVLMDWQLPGIDGLETTRRLRLEEQDRGREPVPVVALTASALPGDRERCLDAGMDDVVTKPVNLATLGRVLDRWTAAVPAPTRYESTGPRSPVDARVLEALVEELEDRELVATVVRTYLRELPARIDSVEAAVRADDRGALAAVAHTLVSTSATIGAQRLAELASLLEVAARDPASSTAPVPVSLADLRRGQRTTELGLHAALERLESSRPASGSTRES